MDYYFRQAIEGITLMQFMWKPLVIEQAWNCENYIYLKGSTEHYNIYLTNPNFKAFHDYERTSWVGFWIVQGCLFYSFDAGLYFLGELLLNIIVFKFIVVPAIIYFPVVFIWTGFTTKFDDKNKWKNILSASYVRPFLS